MVDASKHKVMMQSGAETTRRFIDQCMDRKLIAENFDNYFHVIFQVKIANILSFPILNCEDFMLFFVQCDVYLSFGLQLPAHM